jgi:hypothetical protein
MSSLVKKMDFFTQELREKPIIGIVSGVGSWAIYQVNQIQMSTFFADTNPFWNLISKMGILIGFTIALMTLILKARDFYHKIIKDDE